MSGLFEVTIEVTQRCPNQCIYCSSWSSPDRSEALSFDTICQVVDDAAELGAKLINLSGGEPLLRPDIVAIAERIHSKGMEIRLYSSGLAFDGTYSSLPIELLESLKGKIDHLIFNYESSLPEQYGAIMGTKAENLPLLEETIKRAISVGIPVEAHFVPMKSNFKQIPQTLERLYGLGVEKVSLLRLVPQGRTIENIDRTLLTDDEEEELKVIQQKLSEKYGKRLRLGKPYRRGKYSSCMTGTIRLAVRYDGYVFPCGAFKDGVEEYEGYKPDNVKEKRLKDIYADSAYIKKVREDLEKYYEGVVEDPCYGQLYRSLLMHK